MTIRTQANQKLFSVILATYNSGPKVEDTLQTILSQNKELFELIVVDGASTDDTLDYLKRYEGSFTLISEKDDGIYDAFNKGIDLAGGKYVCFMGAGDRLRPGILEQVKRVLPQEAPSFVYGSCYLMKRQVVWTGREFVTHNLITENICHQAVFYHRDVFKIAGKYDLRYKVFADWVFNLICFTHEKISKCYIPYVIADFEEGGLSSDLDNDTAFKRDFPNFIKKLLGVSAYLKCKALMISPSICSFCYNKCHALKRCLVSIGIPWRYAYRNLKKAIRNRLSF